MISSVLIVAAKARKIGRFRLVLSALQAVLAFARGLVWTSSKTAQNGVFAECFFDIDPMEIGKRCLYDWLK